ncbi:YcdB/YcdC domain-containing protein [Brevibacillus fulvus]|uniref:SLH domain-containing protein n=1 Tax=Brevibacillus fulvus TaxID=1125967 RepID=A0A938XUN5_9BACL|nr:YcdB/YcdC domain-containing protein [Brevibacillus fulvus]MBM7590798.1 hypothetical protein [Brevibacillus fulvus]
MSKLWKRSGALLMSSALLFPVLPAYAAKADHASVASPGILPLPTKPVSAVQASQANLSQSQALQLAQKLIALPKGVELRNSSFESANAWRSFPEWSFYWVKEDATDRVPQISINVGINADTGELTSYYYHENTPEQPDYSSVISRAEAQTIAERFLKEKSPTKVAETQLYTKGTVPSKTPLNSEASYSFRFVRIVNGLPFPDNGIDIYVNGQGKISSFQMNWDNRIQFAPVEQAISAQQARDKFAELTRAELSYIVPWENQRGNPSPILVYQNPFHFYLDAVDGKQLTLELKPRDVEEELIPVSQTALSSRHSGQRLTQENAIAMAEKLFNLSGYQLENINFQENDYRGNRPVWNLYYRSRENNAQEKHLSIAMDAINGDIYSFSKYAEMMPMQSGSVELPIPADLQEEAIKQIRRLTPALASQFYWNKTTNPTSPDSEQVTLLFQRYVNGIQAATGTAYVTFAANGELTNYNVDFGKESYPARVPTAKPAESALSAWLQEAEAELVYMQTPVKMEAKASSTSAAQTQRQAFPVYRLVTTPYETPYAYQAETGNWINIANGNPISLHRPDPTDLSGHPAEKELLLMYEYDALSLKDGKIMPEQRITRGEMIDMLMIALNQGRIYPDPARKASFSDVASNSRYFASVEAAVDRGLLDPSSKTLKPDEPITREELADLIVRALGYKKLADYSRLFAADFTDVQDSKLRGPIAIVTTLGIMSAENNRFQPEAPVSRADAAVAFYRFLEKRGELAEQNSRF